jgi:tRNA threonylcarbamoyl adenosine modification protein YjeE
VRVCSEAELITFAAELVAEIRAKRKPGRPRVVLQGPLGAGKSTLARAMLEAFGLRREAEGSPTFAIAHEYISSDGLRVIHADGYRLKSEAELEATGLLEILWDPEVVVIFEWLDLFSETSDALAGADLPTLWIRLGHFEGQPNLRELEVARTGVD